MVSINVIIAKEMSSGAVVHEWIMTDAGDVVPAEMTCRVKLGAGDLTLLDSDASHNEALLGGAFYVGGSVDLVSTLISDNSANLGGGLFLDERDGSQTLTCDADGVTGSGFVENMAESKGGAVYLDQPIGTTWESSDCDWGTGSTDNGPADVGTPMFSFYASDEADFSCSGYWCSGSVSGELTTE